MLNASLCIAIIETANIKEFTKYNDHQYFRLYGMYMIQLYDISAISDASVIC